MYEVECRDCEGTTIRYREVRTWREANDLCLEWRYLKGVVESFICYIAYS